MGRQGPEPTLCLVHATQLCNVSVGKQQVLWGFGPLVPMLPAGDMGAGLCSLCTPFCTLPPLLATELQPLRFLTVRMGLGRGLCPGT